MKISTIFEHIDSGHMALPEFQRAFTWNRDQVWGLFDSLYKRHRVGGLVVGHGLPVRHPPQRLQHSPRLNGSKVYEGL
jgi:uncharacterized protein with ParB-like and HNH nuclease domain